MGITQISNSGAIRYSGLSSDTKPTGVYSGATFLEEDTGMEYVFNGTDWIQNPRNVVVTGSKIAYDLADDMMKVKSMQKKFRDSFNGTDIDTTKWDITTLSGATYSVTGGLLTATLPTTSGAEFAITTKDVFTIPCRALVGLKLPTRQTGQTMLVEFISVDGNKNPDGQYACAWKIDGTGTATQAMYEVQTGGNARLTSSLSTITDIGTTFNILELEPFADECWFHARSMDSTNGRANSYVRHQQIPDPNKLYKLRIRFFNTTTVATGSLQAQFQYAVVNDYAELTAEITAGRGNNASGQGIYATVTGSVTAGIGSLGHGVYTDSTTNITANNSYTGSNRDFGSTMNYSRFRVMVLHTAGLTHGHLSIEQSTDNTTFRETHRVPVPSDGLYRIFEFPVVLRYARVKFYNGATNQTAFFLASEAVKFDGRTEDMKIINFQNTTTALTGGSSFTGVTLNLGANPLISLHRAVVFADQAGTLYLEQSRDGSTWRTTTTQAITASTATIVEEKIVCQYVRVRYVNGATGQGTFELNSSLLR